MKKALLTAGAFCLAAACKTPHTAVAGSRMPFLKQGHRGTRGLMPENTIPAMEKGILTGANTVEMDVHITRDSQVMVYHDASPNPDYTTFGDGSEISKADRKKYTFYQLDYAEIRKFNIGRKYYAAYPQQQRMDSYAPLLSELIDSVENFTTLHHLPAVRYNVEIKSSPKTDGVEQPAPPEMVRRVMDVLVAKRLGDRLFVQSFDERPLQIIHREYPNILLGYLVENKQSFEENMAKLGFIPTFYNPQYGAVTPGLIRACHEKHIRICPWTVEDKEEMIKLKKMGVDGIITDYPNLLDDL